MELSKEDKDKLRKLILEQHDLDFDFKRFPKFAVRKSWNAIEPLLINKKSFLSLILSIAPEAADIQKSNPEEFDKWMLRQMKKLYDELYDYAWGDYK